ncbi:amidase [Thozetella sp. PMI_491]|nr:amidase [Thozetella sp. PMI_491]
MASQDWQALAENKLLDRSSRIPLDWRLPKAVTGKVDPTSSASAFDLLEQTTLLTVAERRITEKYHATTLINMMATGAISSVEVTTAFCKRAAIAQQLTNCLTEIFFDRALARAKQCDEFLAREGKPIGPFHGMPISLKDTLMVKGEAATLGYRSFLALPKADSNSVLVDMLLDGGAVLYCKTNVPQTLMVCDGLNHVFGQTMNPHKLSLTPGGSSSGEGALVGFRGSILGVGNDIGGSVRVPSLCCGAYAFKPSVNRLPWAGQQKQLRKGWPGVMCTLGPHAQSAEDLTYFCKSIIRARPWLRDSTALASPWREVPRKAKLNIAFFPGDPAFPIFPPVERALKTAAERLAEAGHNVKVVSNPLPLAKGWEILSNSMRLETKSMPRKELEIGEEELIPAVIDMLARSPLRRGRVTIDDVWEFNSEREDYRAAWHEIWRHEDIDVLLCPGSRSTAVPHGEFGPPLYTAIWNLLDFPATVIPFLKVDKEIDIREGAPADYDPETAHGAPCSIQLVGWTGQDEEILMATEVIAEVLKHAETAPKAKIA